MTFFFQIQYSNTAIILATTLILLVSLYKLLTKNNITKHKLTPPPPPLAKGAWPIIGHLHMLANSSTLLHKALGALADEYGPVFTLKLGHQRAIIVSSSDLAQECFTKNDLALSSRPKLLASQHLGFNYAMLGFTPYGPYWREVRKLTTLHLLSSTRLQQLLPIRAAEVGDFIRGLYKVWARNEPAQTLVDLKKEFLELTLNIIVRMVVGKRYHNGPRGGPKTKDDEEEEEGRRWQLALEEVFHLFGIIVVGDFIPWLKWLDIGGHEKSMKRVNKELDTILERLIQEHRERAKLSNSVKDEVEEGQHQDFMDVMLSLLDGTNLGGYNSDHVIKATVFNLIAGGSDTTATTLIWAMSLLLNNRKALKRAQEELSLQIGKHRQVTEQDIPKLVYLQSIVKETLRMYPPSPLSAQHLVVEDCSIGGYHVEKGSRVVVNFSKIQSDPSVWSDPFEFKPERFLTSNVDVKGQHFELIPFSAGRRGCPGSSFALQVVHLTLASLVHAFEFETPNHGAPVDMTESSGLSNMKVGPLEVFITPRLNHQLYE